MYPKYAGTKTTLFRLKPGFNIYSYSRYSVNYLGMKIPCIVNNSKFNVNMQSLKMYFNFSSINKKGDKLRFYASVYIMVNKENLCLRFSRLINVRALDNAMKTKPPYYSVSS